LLKEDRRTGGGAGICTCTCSSEVRVSGATVLYYIPVPVPNPRYQSCELLHLGPGGLCTHTHCLCISLLDIVLCSTRYSTLPCSYSTLLCPALPCCTYIRCDDLLAPLPVLLLQPHRRRRGSDMEQLRATADSAPDAASSRRLLRPGCLTLTPERARNRHHAPAASAAAG
jgi:hypothetical protein